MKTRASSRIGESPPRGPLSSSQVNVHEGFWKVSFVCLKRRLKWKYSEVLQTLCEVHDSGSMTQLWPHSFCGQTSPAF